MLYIFALLVAATFSILLDRAIARDADALWRLFLAATSLLCGGYGLYGQMTDTYLVAERSDAPMSAFIATGAALGINAWAIWATYVGRREDLSTKEMPTFYRYSPLAASLLLCFGTTVSAALSTSF